MQQCIKILFHILWSSTCFGRHTAHHQEPNIALAAFGFAYTEGCWPCSCWTLTASSNYTAVCRPKHVELHKIRNKIVIHCCILLDFYVNYIFHLHSLNYVNQLHIKPSIPYTKRILWNFSHFLNFFGDFHPPSKFLKMHDILEASSVSIFRQRST